MLLQTYNHSTAEKYTFRKRAIVFTSYIDEKAIKNTPELLSIIKKPE